VTELEAAARTLLERNTRTGAVGGRTFRFSIPADRAYPFQWFWDSCFHAIVWARFDRERAADELRSLLVWQRPNGMIPHVVFWDRSAVTVRKFWHYAESRGIPFVRMPRTSECVQPPVLAQALERIGGDFVDEALEPVGRFYRYLARERDPDGDGLVSIVNQFESGLDYSPIFDNGARRRNPVAFFLSARRGEIVNKLLGFDLERIFRLTDHHVEGVLFNTVYADGLAALARLARGRDDELARWAETRAAHVSDALLERCWDDEQGLFFNLCGRRDTRIVQRSIVSLLPLLLPGLPEAVAARLVEHLRNERTFWTPAPVASVPRDDPAFLRRSRLHGVRFIWRGPASANTNWFLSHGLRRHGYLREADELAERSCALAERGFNEFYDPLDGTPCGATDFGWATLVVDMGGDGDSSRQSSQTSTASMTTEPSSSMIPPPIR
jgi:hypothetical protein